MKEKEKEKSKEKADEKKGKGEKKESEPKQNVAEAEAEEADKMAAEASKDKADKLIKLAKSKVKTIVDSYKELDGNLQAEMEELESILMNTKINANFDPDSQEDIDWVAGEIEKILLDTP